MIDHRSYTHNLNSCEMLKKIQAWMGFEPKTSAMLVQWMTEKFTE